MLIMRKINSLLKGLFILIVTFSCTEENPSRLLEESITLSSQEAVDQFGKGNYQIIMGDLRILLGEDITNLNGFASLRQVVGSLEISGNPELTSLSGLEGLVHIHKSLLIKSNPKLKNLAGLTNLKVIGKDWVVESNPVLTSIGAFESLSEVETITISKNALDALPLFNALNSLQELHIYQEPISRINGFNSINIINKINVDGMARLEDLSGFNQLKSVNEEVHIEYCPSLTNVSFSVLTEVQSLVVKRTLIKDFAGFSSLRKVDFLYFAQNPYLENLDGLENLEETWAVSFRDNTSLQNYCAMNPQSGFTVLNLEENGFNPSQDQLIKGECSNNN